MMRKAITVSDQYITSNRRIVTVAWSGIVLDILGFFSFICSHSATDSVYIQCFKIFSFVVRILLCH